MILILALCLAMAALTLFGWLLRERLRRSRIGQKRRYFSVDLAPVPGSTPPDP